MQKMQHYIILHLQISVGRMEQMLSGCWALKF